MKFLRRVIKDIREFEQASKVINGTRMERRFRRKVRRWVNLGSEIFLCNPEWLYRIWKVTLNTPSTLEEIARMAEYLGELGQVGVNGRKADEALRRVILEIADD